MKKLLFIITIVCSLNLINCGDDLGQQTGGQGQDSKKDTDGDGEPDSSDTDDDNDSILDASDNCPLKANKDQKDEDNDSVGDACDSAPSDNTIPNPTPPANEGISPVRNNLVSPACDNDSCFNLTTKLDFLTCSVISCESVVIAPYLDELYYATINKQADEKQVPVFSHYADDDKEHRKFLTGLDVIEDELQELDPSIEDGSLEDMNNQEIYSLVRENFTSHDELISVLKDVEPNVDVKVKITTIEEDGSSTTEEKVIDETKDKDQHRIIQASSSAQDAFTGADDSDLYWTLNKYMEDQIDDYITTHELPN